MTYRRTRKELTGTGACAGVAEGKAKYITWAGPHSPASHRTRRAQQLKDIEEGDIIITRMTTPEIMPFIKKVAGLVTEVGGIVCHAAIVAREYNIPTVIACPGAVKSVWRRKNPTPVKLDGMAGTVVLDDGA